ncbi:hypothetical protein Mapa_001682 [Marchantia paleacea]|nr:hypothetical protein Mapa_001682 [Marchantia paleacea]
MNDSEPPNSSNWAKLGKKLIPTGVVAEPNHLQQSDTYRTWKPAPPSATSTAQTRQRDGERIQRSPNSKQVQLARAHPFRPIRRRQLRAQFALAHGALLGAKQSAQRRGSSAQFKCGGKE